MATGFFANAKVAAAASEVFVAHWDPRHQSDVPDHQSDVPDHQRCL